MKYGEEKVGKFFNFNKYANKHKDILIPNDKEVYVRFEIECDKQLQFD